MNTIPDHVGREAVRLLNEAHGDAALQWPANCYHPAVITVAKLLMNPPERMTDPDEEAAKRVLGAIYPNVTWGTHELTRATEQMRREREVWEAGR